MSDALRSRWFARVHAHAGVALDDGHARVQGPALAQRIGGVARALGDEGVQAGDRVALLGLPSTAQALAVLAVQAVGAIPVPLGTRHTTAELQHVVDDSGATVLLLGAELRERGNALASSARVLDRDAIVHASPSPLLPAPGDDEDAALLVYTSGTTGRSKGVVLPWRALVGNMEALGAAWGFCAADRLSLSLPLFHVHGLCIGIFAALLHGVSVLLHARFEPASTLADLRDRGATVFMGVPTMYVQWLEHLAAHPDDAAVLARARLFTAGSAPLPPRVFAEFARATGHAILERYGMTETLITLSNPLQGERRVGTVGVPVPGVRMRIVDEHDVEVARGTAGELQIAGSSLMRGYWRDADATAAALCGEFFRTGDIACEDPDGYVRIVGRASTDIIKSGGFKLSAREIEDVLREHPAVADVAIVAVTDARWGERVGAAIVPAAGAPALPELAASIRALARAQLADYKCPRQIVLLSLLPRNAMGKLDKRALRAQLEGGEPGDADARDSHT
ncbi:MAG: AMP-binding protein [Nannocystaceae bacterium]|nr:AMP-binding protein [Nannocystaceae bacterium]